MIENRELTMDDYLAMLRRRAKVILVPALVAPLAGFLVSYGFHAKYTSQSMLLVESQKVPESMVKPVVSEDLAARVATLQQRVLSQADLEPVIERLQLAKGGKSVDDVVDDIRANMNVEEIEMDLPQSKTKPGVHQTSAVPAFNISYTAANAGDAQKVCAELASLMVDENLKSIAAAANGTSDVLTKGLEDAKHNLDDLDARLAAFKKQYVGQLPGDEESNLKILTGLNSQLDANTQTLNRAQQDKAYTESVLAQQIGAWKSSQSSTNPQTLEKQLSDLQAQLLDLQAKYTDDHPDVIKTKSDIASVKRKLAEINKNSSDPGDAPTEKASGMEPPEIRQLRLQLHQYEDLIGAATRDQKRLQQEINSYESKVSLSPAIEEQYKAMARDYDNAQKSYEDLLGKKSEADLTVKMNNQSQGERMFVLNPANVPDAPSFPLRWLFALGGLGAGMGLGLGLTLWLELRDKAIRNEADAEAALDLPMLAAVPWVGVEEEPAGANGKYAFWKRNHGNGKSAEEHDPDKHRETIGV